MVTNGDFLGPKAAESGPHEYHCKKCDYITSHLSHWKRHIKTKKHNGDSMVTNGDSLGPKAAESGRKNTKHSNPCPELASPLPEPKEQKNNLIPEKAKSVGNRWTCSCGRGYKYKQGYYRHKAKCDADVDNVVVHDEDNSYELPDVNLLYQTMNKVMEQNSALMKMVTEGGNNHHNTTNSHNDNRTFNISFFLNEQCKNALSIQDFARSLQNDLQRDQDLICGDPSRITNIISRKLEGLSQIERPLHTHDAKWYVKDKEEGWEDDQNGKVVDVVNREISRDALSRIPEKYPNWRDSSHRDSAMYAEAVAAATKDLDVSDKRKVMRNLRNKCTIRD